MCLSGKRLVVSLASPLGDELFTARNVNEAAAMIHLGVMSQRRIARVCVEMVKLAGHFGV